jgi:acyl carrier protein phosphodiesterase
MNLLAHALLTPSPPSPAGVLVGNLTADWIKGRARLALSADLQAGIAIHRRIDAFTDMHPLVEQCSSLLAPRWNRYAPVLVDIFFDHILSVEWSRYASAPLPEFIQGTYASLRACLDLLPARAQWASNALLADDWLSTYATLEGIGLSLSRLSARLGQTGHTIQLAPATEDFLVHQGEFHRAFHAFFPQLRKSLDAP